MTNTSRKLDYFEVRLEENQGEAKGFGVLPAGGHRNQRCICNSTDEGNNITNSMFCEVCCPEEMRIEDTGSSRYLAPPMALKGNYAMNISLLYAGTVKEEIGRAHV